MKTAIVTGAGGFIGGALTRELLRRGWRVYGVDIRPLDADSFGGGFIPVCADLTCEDFPYELDEPADAAFNLALAGSMRSADLYNVDLQIKNITTAVKLFEKLSPLCRRFVFVSSSYEYMRDSDGCGVPFCIYGTAKKAAAEMCASLAYRSGVGFTKAVLTNTFGVGDRSDKAVNTIIGKMLRCEPLSLVEGKNKNDWVYIDDTVRGLIAVAEAGKDFKEYYIGHRDITTFREKIEYMRDLLCPSMELNFGTMPESTYIDYSAMDLDVLYEDTGCECTVDFGDAIRKTAKWVNDLRRNAGG